MKQIRLETHNTDLIYYGQRTQTIETNTDIKEHERVEIIANNQKLGDALIINIHKIENAKINQDTEKVTIPKQKNIIDIICAEGHSNKEDMESEIYKKIEHTETKNEIPLFVITWSPLWKQGELWEEFKNWNEEINKRTNKMIEIALKIQNKENIIPLIRNITELASFATWQNTIELNNIKP